MVALGPVIPLYFNPDMVNNLFSILIQEFIEARSISVKKQVLVNVKTPLSEFSDDIWGRYVQGELNFQTMEEFITQRAEENISANIIALTRLMDILGKQNYLKRIDDESQLSCVNEGDFVNFSCRLNENPVFQHVNHTINKLEALKCCCMTEKRDEKEQNNSSNVDYDKLLTTLKNGLNECRNTKCVRYVSDSILNSESKAVVPVETKNMLVNNDYMLNGSVRVIGKVTRTNNIGGAVSVANTPTGTEIMPASGTMGTTGTTGTSGTTGTTGTTATTGAARTNRATGAAGAGNVGGIGNFGGIGGLGGFGGIGGAQGAAGAGNAGFILGVPGFSGLNLLSGTYFDNINYEQFNNLGGSSLVNSPVFSNFGGDIFNPAFPLMEVLPIAIFV